MLTNGSLIGAASIDPRMIAAGASEAGNSMKCIAYGSPPLRSLHAIGPSCELSRKAGTPIVFPLRSLPVRSGASLAQMSTVVGAALEYCAAGAM